MRPRGAYKLFQQRSNGDLHSLFIDKKSARPLNVWLKAEEHITNGFAIRTGWHATAKPSAPHLSMHKRVWAKVLVKDYITFERPKQQGGTWLIAKWIKITSVN